MTFRSLDMKHYTMIIPQDNAYTTISQISQFENVHFIDAGDHLNRRFQQQLKRLQQLLQNINSMKFAVKQAKLQYKIGNQLQNDYIQKMCDIWHSQAKQHGVEDIKLIDLYQTQVLQQYKRYQQTIGRLDKLLSRKKQILQQIAINQTILSFFGQSNLKQESNKYFQNYMGQNIQNISGISYVVGCIDKQSQMRFNRMIYRISRGYACTRSLQNFKFPGLAEFSDKIVMVLYPSSTSAILQKKITKVMQMFCNSVTQLDKYQLKSPLNNSKNIQTQYYQTESYIQMNQKQLKQFFQHICQINCLQKWSLFVWKQKCTYQTLNKLQVRGQLLIGNIYIPKQQVKQLSINLNRLSPAPTLQQVRLNNPPTAFSTNSYTTIAQQITDTYGVPRYKQMNPSIFTTITFPFFFGVMFGDIGHGLILFVLGIYLVFNDGWISKSGGVWKIFSRLRYMIILMGFFAFYCGWIYNDMIGFNYNFFGSCFNPKQIDPITHRVYPKQGCIYPFGVDPIWGLAQNQLVYINSLKMKLSVIIAIIHMTFGIIIKAMNSLYFKKKLDFYFQFIPQIIFMVILFGYMDFLIIFKWLKNWDYQTAQHISGRQWAPSIISTMMNIGLAMGKTGQKPDGNGPMWGQIGSTWQNTLQLFILLCAFLCIPIMLLPKPLIEISKLKKTKKYNNPLQNENILQSQGQLERSLLSSQRITGGSSLVDQQSDGISSPGKGQAHGHQQHGDAGEIFVHQLIETIQFCLGAVSNTASYLRLWALSLAHSQLAKVFFQKSLKNSFQMSPFTAIVPNIIFFWLLCWITFGVLMCMDSMECFLHSLRLHWVEFQNKFYKGDGYRFNPVSLRLFIEERKEEERK